MLFVFLLTKYIVKLSKHDADMQTIIRIGYLSKYMYIVSNLTKHWTLNSCLCLLCYTGACIFREVHTVDERTERDTGRAKNVHCKKTL